MSDHSLTNQMNQQQALWLPCPFCGSPAIEAMWAGRRGCSDPTCGAHMANLSIEQWNRRPAVEPSASRKYSSEDYERVIAEGGNVWSTLERLRDMVRAAHELAVKSGADLCAICDGVFIDHRHGALGHDWKPKPSRTNV